MEMFEQFGREKSHVARLLDPDAQQVGEGVILTVVWGGGRGFLFT